LSDFSLPPGRPTLCFCNGYPVEVVEYTAQGYSADRKAFSAESFYVMEYLDYFEAPLLCSYI